MLCVQYKHDGRLTVDLLETSDDGGSNGSLDTAATTTTTATGAVGPPGGTASDNIGHREAWSAYIDRFVTSDAAVATSVTSAADTQQLSASVSLGDQQQQQQPVLLRR